ncbi:MAG: hypothetical protein WC841_02800 [Candidatus Shapirobacteria bacterium]|jgi:hypothetical protein
MFKEFVLAIILGALLGFGLTGGYFALNANKKNNQLPAITPSPIPLVSQAVDSKISPEPSEKPTIQNPDNLTVDSPKNESVVNNSKTTVSGNSSPQSTIIITTAQKTYSQTASEDGAFSIDIELESGANKINVSSIGTGDSQTDIQLIITYSTAKI